MFFFSVYLEIIVIFFFSVWLVVVIKIKAIVDIEVVYGVGIWDFVESCI